MNVPFSSTRSVSGFGMASAWMGYVLAVGVTAAAMASVPWSGRDGDRIAAVALPLCVVGGAFGIVGVVRPSKHRTAGVLGLFLNVATGLAVALLWLVTHVPR